MAVMTNMNYAARPKRFFTQALLVTVLTIFKETQKQPLEKQQMNHECFVIDKSYDPLEYKVVLFILLSIEQ